MTQKIERNCKFYQKNCYYCYFKTLETIPRQKTVFFIKPQKEFFRPLMLKNLIKINLNKMKKMLKIALLKSWKTLHFI